MAFNPNEPQNGEEVDADVLRNQFNALNDAITIIPVGPQGRSSAGCNCFSITGIWNDRGRRSSISIQVVHALLRTVWQTVVPSC